MSYPVRAEGLINKININHGLQAFLTVSLYKLLMLSSSLAGFIFSVTQSFLGPTLNRALHKIIKEIAILGVKRLDVKGDLVAEVFSQP